MAKQSSTFTPPVATVFTELWYSETENGAPTQVFGVQSIPAVASVKEDITYRVLESDEEGAYKGVRAFEAIEVELISQYEQHKALKALSDANNDIWWFVKLPNAYSGEADPLVLKWRGSIDIAFSEIALDDMVKETLKIGKSTTVTEINGLPGAGV